MEELLRKALRYLDILNENRYHSLGVIPDVRWTPCGYKKPGELPDPATLVPFDTEKDTWGNGYDSHAWFAFDVCIPEDYCNCFLSIVTGRVSGWDPENPQFLVYVDGEMVQGMDINHTRLYFRSAGVHTVTVYAYTGIKTLSASMRPELFRLNRTVEKLWYDIKVPVDSLQYLDPIGGEYRNILDRVNRALLLLDVYEVPSESFFASAERASDYMDREFYGNFCSKPNGNEPTVVGIGHTHIDCAWQWTLKQTREKVQRSFTNVLELMDRYPEYRFISSQALLYQNLKEEAPEIYEKVRDAVREGKWEVEGAMWVEADCNLTSGESLVRQVMYGKRFFRQEFGVENRILWLPDVFGYSAALPQILRKSGVDWFVTSKISWNDTNMMPYDTFLWKGIDGTEINSYFLTAQDQRRDGQLGRFTTYVAHVTPAQVAGTYRRYQQKELSNETLITFGYGDGGGGSTEADLEYGRRLSRGIPGTPGFRIDFAGNMLSRLEKKIDGNPRLPVWQGELYLEFHRGTYTTQYRNKKNNRRSEELYLMTEWLCSLNAVLLGTSFPKAELHRGWEMILTNQFHDIIPGSSIRAVYEQCERDYETIRQIAQPHMDAAQKQIAAGISSENGYVVFNPNPTPGNGIIRIDGKSVAVSGIPPKGYACVKTFAEKNMVKLSSSICENGRYRLCFDGAMNLSSVYDKKNRREVLRHGGLGNELRIYEDYVGYNDAWDLEEYNQQKYISLTDVQSVEEVLDGVRAGLRITRKFLKSTFVQTVWLSDATDRIDFDLQVDWQERHQCVKVAFDVAINSLRATYEIQYGTVERPTHKNTSWEKAKFEVCGHRFADYSEGGYGVALLNDCKYGYDIHGTLMTLTLLRAPTFPDPEADRGEMTCCYSLYPHSGPMNAPALYTEAYALNNPMTVLPASGTCDRLPTRFSTVSCDRDNILCEVIKEAEDSEDCIFRFFECGNTATTAVLRFGYDVRSVILCDMEEREIRELSVKDRSVTLDFGAFEIQTLKVKR